MRTTNDNSTMDCLLAIPDSDGHFQFTNLPAGNYVAVAQAWNAQIQPTNSQFFRGETIHLLGSAEVTVPADAALKLNYAAVG